MSDDLTCKQCGAKVDSDHVMADRECPSCGHNEFLMPRQEHAVCDFCSHPNVKHAYPASDFRHEIELVAGAPTWGSLGWWAACPACYRMIERGDRTGLAMRSAKRQMKMHPELRGAVSLREVTAEVRRLHDHFWSNRQGPAIEHLEVQL